jgi:hypothetical protein
MNRSPSSGVETNPYVYVINNPIAYVDPDGAMPKRFDKFYNLPKKFWNWFHRRYKDKFDDDLPEDEARRLYQDWLDEGCPGPDKKKPRRSRKKQHRGEPETEWWEDLLEMIVPFPPVYVPTMEREV